MNRLVDIFVLTFLTTGALAMSYLACDTAAAHNMNAGEWRLYVGTTAQQMAEMKIILRRNRRLIGDMNELIWKVIK